MNSIRTLAVTISPLLTGLIAEVLKPGLTLDLVGVLQSRATLADMLQKLTPDLVVFGLVDDETEAVTLPFRAILPSAVILVLSPGGDCAWLHQRDGCRIVLRHLSISALANALATCFSASPPKG